ncbi:MAG: glycosyltransferase [Erysipelotrichaceae bacterium]
MKILWVVNISFPDVVSELNLNSACYGGWLLGLSGALIRDESIELGICNLNKSITNIEKFKKNGIKYYVLPFDKNKNSEFSSGTTDLFKEVYRDFQPDIVHIHGTEFGHSLSALRACSKTTKNVISIQGLTSLCSYHYLEGIPLNVKMIPTIRDIIRRDSIMLQVRKFEKRGKLEINCLKETQNIIGRTNWDEAVTFLHNNNRSYYCVNEILRDAFYTGEWLYEKCNKHSIFVSQSSYPIKGFHLLLKSLAIIKKEIPDIKVRVSGDLPYIKGLKGTLLQTRYGNYIKKTIKKLKLEDTIVFLGNIDEMTMKEEFLKANVFVSPSIVENESNSVSEAKILGVPVVSSYVGGVAQRIEHGVDGFTYPHMEYYMLAFYVVKLLNNTELSKKIGYNAQINARIVNDVGTNIKALKSAYLSILNKKD